MALANVTLDDKFDLEKGRMTVQVEEGLRE